MSGSVNKVILIGNVGRDPEVKSFSNGNKVCNLSVATSEVWKDRQSGERKERTEWHTVAIFSDPLIKVAEQYIKKGSRVYIEGQLETRKWQDQAGNDRYSTEVVLRPYRGEITLLDRRDGGDERDGESDRTRQGSNSQHSNGNGSANNHGAGGYPSNRAMAAAGFPDDEIPFEFQWK